MNKMRWKKAAALLMASVMMVSMAACGKNDKGSSGSKEKKENKKEMTYEESDLQIDGIKGDIASYQVVGDRIYFFTTDWVENGTGEEGDSAEEGSEEDIKEEAASEETSEEDTATEEATEEDTEEASEDSSEDVSSEEDTEEEDTEESEEDTSEEDNTGEVTGTSYYYVYSMKADGTDLQELGSPQLNENEYINYMLVKSDGTIQFLLGAYDQKSEKTQYALVAYDENGKEASREDVTKVLGLTDESYLNKALIDDQDRYVFATDQAVIVLDKDLKKVCEMKPDSNYVEGIAKAKDGKILVADSSGDKGAKVQILDVDAQKWGESYNLDLQYFSSSDALMNGIEYDFYYKDDAGIYGYDIASKKSTKVMDYVASNISSDNSYNITPIAKDTMMGTTWDESGSKVVIYKKVDPSTITDKETITVGAMYVDDNVKKAAIDFNKKNNKYQIEFKDYSNEEDPQTKMNADIIAGNVPDILCLSGLFVDQYVEKGILEDLTSYYEKDSDVSADDMIPSVAKAMQIDGKYYYIAPGFYVNTLVGAAKTVGTEPGWTMDDLKKLLDEHKDARPFYSENKNDNLYNFITMNISDYVDWSTGECTFDGQDFKDILEICNRGTNEETDYSEDSPSEPSLIKEGKVLLTNGGSLDMESVELYEAMFNGDITFIGYPNKDKDGSYFSFDNQLGIYSKSKNKDAAWEFLKTFLTKEYQGNRNNLYSNPTRQDAFDMLVKSKTATEKYTDELGNEVEPLETGWGWDDLNVDIGPLTDKQAQMYIDLVNNTDKTGEYNNEIGNIITEEAKAYFSGQKSLDETVDVIQNRVKTYVNENR
ncbi:MAG: extracellular solute-binding protein [Lachnospiraceae bacterium]|nr:extracellular solute-binding protein [Lachnospiraceae bacterium]